MKRKLAVLKRVPKWLRIVVISIVSLLIIFHVFISPIVKYLINKELNQLDGYYGHLDDVDIHLFRGNYQLEGLHIYSDELGERFPLYESKKIIISIDWKALRNKSLVAEIEIVQPRIYFATALVENDQATETANSAQTNFDKIQLTIFRDLLLDKIPLRINRLSVKDGLIRYIDKTKSPVLDANVSNLNFKLNNLTNSLGLSSTMIATFSGSAQLMKTGKMSFSGSFDPYDSDVTMDIDLKMTQFHLTELNDFFVSFADLDLESGVFSLYSEIKSNQGNIEGYVKPFVVDLDVASYPNDKERFGNYLWQSLVGGITTVFTNRRSDEVASKLILKGSINDPQTKILPAIGNLIIHTLFHSIKPTIDNEFTFGSIKK